MAKPILLAINHNGPVRVTALGQGHEGISWEVAAEDLDKLVEYINAGTFGASYRITPLN